MLPQVWSLPQRTAIIFLLFLLAGWLAYRLHRDPVVVPADLPTQGPRAGELLNQLDLNTADAISLAVIPHLGEKKAKDIVEFRDKYMRERGRSPFERLEDLYRVKGIGAATIAQVRPFVAVTTRPTTAP